ncbi:hypothetical protein ASPWEDRAFT_167917 [Aspergillus wentii DTO 134E9]|uniref:Zn(2)-C6 fungal-type domain-containing protein n=1 Tax=Aspergillus wentii DTO 134E9 TaxID=1073089 RepID=A0A1L9S468_ASPWE|nr:uncharacterized protein ASPWEDRAFT_167917 [Aspergillus wentii DTO 134E9]OJJ41927.1 hypothetical protein ASPWEDRAFT_167917 [Aspergillus wentii DTO 134E9]
MDNHVDKDKPRRRQPISCDPCRRSKLRCDRHRPCSSCRRRRCEDSCRYKASSSTESSPAIPSRSSVDHHESTHDRWDAVLQRPTIDHHDSLGSTDFPFSFGHVSIDELLARLPPSSCCDYLITQYFMRLSPMFHILHGPTFQKQYNGFIHDPSSVDLSWLALLFLICSVTLNTMAGDDPTLADLWIKYPNARDIPSVSCQLRSAAMICLSQDQFLIRHRLTMLEALLILIYTISHNEGVERSWTLLGIALNMGIALRCNSDSAQLNCIENERRRRCWAGILMLHTYQAILFRDIDMSSLLDIPATMPADVNDADITPDRILRPSSQPTQMSVMMFKIRLFQLSSRLCRHIASPAKFDETALTRFDAQIEDEQKQWDAVFLLDGSPSVLDTSSYAHWCILQLYAHQLYLLLHRPFCRSQSNPRYRSVSRTKCMSSSVALLDLHRQLWELPRLRYYRWLIYGMTSFYALHGAVALASCLLDGTTIDSTSYRETFDSAVSRIEVLRTHSPICRQAYPMLLHLQSLLSPGQSQSSPRDFNTFDEWVDAVQWLNPDSVNWNFWGMNEPNI